MLAIPARPVSFFDAWNPPLKFFSSYCVGFTMILPLLFDRKIGDARVWDRPKHQELENIKELKDEKMSKAYKASNSRQVT